MPKDETLTDDRLLFVDIESTGLTNHKPGGLYNGGLLLEVCLLLTTGGLEYLGHKSLVIGHDLGTLTEVREAIPVFVRDMHDQNRLWRDSAVAQLDEGDVEGELLRWLAHHRVPQRTLPMCGSSVHTDREWLRKHLPDVHDWFGYRNVDVSTVKELAKRWYPGGRRPMQEPRGEHRAYPDLLDTLDELRHYRSCVFQPIIPVPAAAEV